MIRLCGCLLLLPLTIAGCVKSIPGYDGPAVDVVVADDTADVSFMFPSSGWSASIDRWKIENNTAMVWINVTHDGGMSSQVMTPGKVVFNQPGKSFACCEVFVKAARSSHPTDHVPAGEGCE
ncbi:MAG: hypothetical protein CMJ39_06265 [Phycisphaerae bacterium]|nr:hypothetical protein [Phycisphaerae bacterium]|tara:strand:+ start:467 stop:832 length:366 start_codon:yes stop_codon:yes gene_type:complete